MFQMNSSVTGAVAANTPRCISILLLTISMSLIVPSLRAETVFRWIDANGKIHYGDRDSGATAKNKTAVDVETDFTGDDAALSDETAVAPKVVMYSTSWCGYCKRARAFFKRNAVEFTEYDIERSPVARKVYDRLGGRGVPFITVGDQQISGYDKQRLRDALGI